MTANLIAIGAAALICAGGVAACADTLASDRSKGQSMSEQTIENALRARRDELLALPGLVGTAQGLCEGRPCIKVYVTERSEELERSIRRILAGYPVVIEESGPVRARP